ncbi:MAG: ATP-binding cassette domain-containing protein [Pseudomonadota bacterium]
MLLTIRGLTKSYATREGPLAVLRGVDLDLDRGESLALLGESGSGKSTLLHLAAGLDAADGGTITLDGVSVAAMTESQRAAVRRDRIGLVFQQFNLIPSLDAGANIALQARLAGRNDPDWNAHLARAMGLERLLDRYPEDLSGGQQQRVAIARALAARPALVLADEPTGNLDEVNADTVLGLMLALVAETGAALLLVTHSQRQAARLGRRMRLVMGQSQP